MATAARQSRFRVAAAIDFGTHSTGYAWVPVNEHNDVPARREIKFNTQWRDQPVPGVKTLSAVLLTADDEVEAWGYEARKMRSAAAGGASYHHAFKLGLCAVRPGDGQDRAATQAPLTPERATTVAAAFLRKIVSEAVREITASGYPEDGIRWCLTVPAIWDGHAISLTRQAAVQAGLPGDPERLRLVREPEAAALHCLIRGAHLAGPHRKPAITRLPRDARYMIVDCGGGTVDISAYEVGASGQLSQIGNMFGGTFGSESLNHAFITEILADRTGGIDKIADLTRSHPEVLVELAEKWEDKKLTVDVAEDAGSVRVKSPVVIPMTLQVYRALKEVTPDLEQRLRKSQDDDQDIIVQPGEIVQIFDRVVEKIIDEVEKQLAAIAEHYGKPSAREKILLVGGFAQSRYLQLRMKLRLKDRATVLVSPEGAAAVLTGAVHFCYDPTPVGTRLSRYTYGFATCMPFETGDPEDSKTICDYTGETLCSTRFSRVVKIRKSVPVNYEVGTTVFPTTRDQDAISIQLFTSPEPNPRYVTESTEQGHFTIDLLTGKDIPLAERGVDLKFRFCGAEIVVTARELCTGNTVIETITFERNTSRVPPPIHRLLRRRMTGLTGQPALNNLSVAEEYDKLVDQRLLPFAREQAGGDHPDTSLRRALWVAGLSLLLFNGELRPVEQVYDSLGIDWGHPKSKSLAQMVSAARRLRTAPAQVTWDFRAKAGSRIGAGQAAWGRCDPQQPVRFVVVPALLIGGLPYRPQQVFTSSADTPIPEWPPRLR